MSRRIKHFPMQGGENLVDPILEMLPGELQESLNYEPATNGGYRRVKGFERFDGRTKPSSLLKSSYPSLDDWGIAVEAARALIQPVPGNGPIRGVCGFEGNVYAFRDNLVLTVCVMFKATPTGWQEVVMNHQLSFNTGSIEIFPGQTITGVTSGATAVVSHIHVDSGGWDTNDAAGHIHFHPDTLVGVFQAESITSAVITGPSVAETFPPGGTYEFVNYNFYGLADFAEMYGCNGVGQGFGFDGNNVKFIHTGTPVDAPKHVFAHKKHLFFAFDAGSVQHSSPGSPYEFNAITGAAELTIGEDCTGFGQIPGETLVMFGRNRIELLYGSNATDWSQVTFSQDSGAVPYSIRNIGYPVFLDDRGVKILFPSQDYGDFNTKTISQKIKPLIASLVGKFSCSLRVRTKDQYRLFFNNGKILLFAFDNGKLIGITRGDYGKRFTSSRSAELLDGTEILLAGDDNGMVYQLDSGNSFDGAEVVAYIRPIFHHFSSPENTKRFMKMVLEIDAVETVNLSFVPEFSYGDSYFPNPEETPVTVEAGAGIWDESFWEDFYWDTQAISTAFGYLVGIGKNFRCIIRSVGRYESPHSIQGTIIHFSAKGIVK